jgi:hypothetical protein
MSGEENGWFPGQVRVVPEPEHVILSFYEPQTFPNSSLPHLEVHFHPLSSFLCFLSPAAIISCQAPHMQVICVLVLFKYNSWFCSNAQNISCWTLLRERTIINILLLKTNPVAQYQWLKPVILATQEAEIRRITVWRQPGQIVCKTLSWKNPSQKRAGGVAQGVGPEFKSYSSKPTPPKQNQKPKPVLIICVICSSFCLTL